LSTGARKWWVKVDTQGASTPVAGPDAVYVGTWFNVGEPDLRVALPTFDELLKQYDKNGDGLISADEFPARILISRRVGLDGVQGADSSNPGESIFQSADRNHDGKLDRPEWEGYASARTQATQSRDHGLLAIQPGGAGDVTKTRVLWKETRGVPEVTAPLYYKSRVYMATNGGIVTCLDAVSGKLVYRGRLGADGAYFASPVAAAERIYYASSEGIVTATGAGDHLEVLARNDMQEQLFATPAIIGNVIYVRTPTLLYAFGQ
jgi:hypothetical protein